MTINRIAFQIGFGNNWQFLQFPSAGVSAYPRLSSHLITENVTPDAKTVERVASLSPLVIEIAGILANVLV